MPQFTLLGLSALLVVSGCGSDDKDGPEETGSTDSGSTVHTGHTGDTAGETGAPDARTPKVLMVMLDGFIPAVISLTDTPAMDQLLDNSAWSMNARAESTTISGSGWSTFVTGVHWDKHGSSDNSFEGTHYEDYRHIFALAREALPEIVVAGCQSWDGIEEGLVLPAKPDFHSYYDYYEYSDDYFDEDSPDRFCGADLAEWAGTSEADLYVVMFADTDGVGHGYGYGAEYPRYQQEITEVDGYILDILQAIESRPTRNEEDWRIIVTADHAGEPVYHHGYNIPAHREMPLIVSGDSVVPGEIWPPPAAVDVVATALDHLGVRLEEWPDWNLDGSVLGGEQDPIPTALLGSNLLFNGDAEFERGYSGYGGVPDASIPGWKDQGYLTTVLYDSPDGYPTLSDPGPESRGLNFFAGGGVSYDTEMSQRVDVSNLALEVDSGVEYTLSGWLGGYSSQNDRAQMDLKFLKADGTELAVASVAAVGAGEREGATGLFYREAQGVVPQGTRQIEVILKATWASGYNDGYADNLSVIFSNGESSRPQ